MYKKARRNDPCPCNSGKKYKKCCWNKNTSHVKKKITAKALSGKMDLVQRTKTLTNFIKTFEAHKDEKKPS